MVLTVNSAFSIFAIIALTSSSLSGSSFPFSVPWSFAVNLPLFGAILPRSASSVQNSRGTKSRISFSRSITRRVATDCTRPADRPYLTFFQRSGESLYPTILSRSLRACWAFTRFSSISRGCLIPSHIAFFVISLKVTLRVLSSGSPRSSFKCHEIASPSRSGSVARYIASLSAARLLSSFISALFPRIATYFGMNPPSMSMARVLLGKSRRCPIEAFTLYLLPRCFPIVLTFVGDSTITRYDILLSVSADYRLNTFYFKYISRLSPYFSRNFKHCQV